jgi:orotidine-5'-phosphate decarboxylase
MQKCAPLKNPLILALDVDDEAKAWQLVDETADLVGGIKIGPRLMLRYGPSFLKKVATRAPVFLDMKFFDIPSTMVSAVRSAFDIGASLVTVHAQAGVEALQQLARLEEEYRKTSDVKILAVTILTSFDKSTLPEVLRDQSIEAHVDSLVGLVKESGMNGVVCSPHELSALAKYDGLYLVTPGIRLKRKPEEDQKRVMGPEDALQAGATAIVVGRPILEAASPRDICVSWLKHLNH